MIILWSIIALAILDNFEDDFQRLVPWKRWVLQGILIIFAPVFFIDELLEMVVDWIVGDEE